MPTAGWARMRLDGQRTSNAVRSGATTTGGKPPHSQTGRAPVYGAGFSISDFMLNGCQLPETALTAMETLPVGSIFNSPRSTCWKRPQSPVSGDLACSDWSPPTMLDRRLGTGRCDLRQLGNFPVCSSRRGAVAGGGRETADHRTWRASGCLRDLRRRHGVPANAMLRTSVAKLV